MRPLSPPGSRFPRSTTQSLVDVDCTRVVHVLYWSVYSRGTAGKGSTCSTGGVCGDCGDLFVCGVFSVWLGESLFSFFFFFVLVETRMFLGAETFFFNQGPVCWIYVSEIPTARLRALNVSIAAATQWLFNFVVARATPTMIATVGRGGFGAYL